MKRMSLFLAGLALAVALVVQPASAAYHVVRTLPIGGDGGWDCLTVDSHAHRLYITRGSHVMVVDTKSGLVVGDITGLSGVHAVAIDSDAGRGFITNGQSNSVTIFDLKTLQKIGDVPVGEGPDGILYDPLSGFVFSFNGHDQAATAIDATAGKVAGTVKLPGRPEFAAVDDIGRVYCNIEDKSEVAAFDTQALAVTHVWELAPGEGPSGLALDINGERIFSACDNQQMVVLDAGTGDKVTTLPIGNGPDGCVFDAKKNLVFIPNGRDGTLTIYHQTKSGQYELDSTVPTQAGARTIALDEKTHHVFVVTAKEIPPAPGSDTQAHHRRNYVPGSFVVIELAP